MSPTLRLNNGVEMPALGLGVYQLPPARTAELIRTAIGAGYRLIDTASLYGNEKEVGEGIAGCGIDRRDIFVQTKLWVSDFGYDSALHAFERSRKLLAVEYVDLYLLHWPAPAKFDDTIASYLALAQLLADGRVRAIGVSNFTPAHFARLREHSDVVPAVNQIELHPFFIQRELRDANARAGIITQSWSPLGGANVYAPRDAAARHNNPMQSPVIQSIAQTHHKTPAQIVLRWHIEHGLSVIPKSAHAERIRENIDVFDFALTQEEIQAIDALDTGERGGPDPDVFGR
jgi:diketogulonate reductase-like aldo/keto reductase